jgi:cell volume regulation protein A
METYPLIILVSLLILIAIVIYNPAKTRGVPAALIFILMGFFIGNGEVLPAYNYPEATEFVSQFALSIIIFTGGLHTPVARIKPVLGEGLVLSNIGILLTTTLVGIFASLVTPLTLMEGMLLGAIVSSTDAAATFSILEAKKLKLKHNADKTLEFESATNDPMALILTLMFCNILLQGGGVSIWSNVLFFLQQLFIGGLVALAVGISAKWIFKHLKFTDESLKPISILALLLVTTLGAQEIGGNQLVASYILGLILGNSEFRFKTTSQKVFDSFTWLAQALMFVLLGLQIFPGQVLEVLSLAWLPTVFLFIIARPVSVLISFLPFKQPFRKQLFVSWIGIKGATPIVFALVPLIMDVPKAEMIFNITVVIVIVSMILHGFSLDFTAKRLKMIDEE